MEASREGGRGYPAYRTLWAWLLLGWTVSYADRTITGPVVTYMIENDLAFVQGVDSPFALGGLIGSMFFAGYMLTQFPGGYLGDRFGHRTIIVISIVWAGVATLISGLMTALIGFVALRVITGLGEGTFYSNDRSVITEQTPFEKRSLGMGIVITGLAIGLTLALLFTQPLINLGSPLFGAENAWRTPFFVLGVITVIVGFGMHRFFKGQRGEFEFRSAYGSALKGLAGYTVVLLLAVMVVYYLAILAGLPEWAVAGLVTVLAFALIAFIFGNKGGEVSPILYNRDLMLIYIAFIAVLWHLWFFGFWAVSITSEAAGGATLLRGALTAAFFGVAGILGFPAGGWLADYAKEKGWGRKTMLAAFLLILGLMTVGFGFYIMGGGQSLFVMGIILFVSSLFFFALQPMAHALAADITLPAYMGAMFGMMNLIGEIGAVLSPAISGVLRGATGNWTTAVMLDGAIVLAGFVLIVFVRETRAPTAGKRPSEGEATSGSETRR
jgi:ACS family D-galactonate transporter-like MFS transporter